MLLQKRVAEARRECNNEPCIIIAHSMGGLVARYFCAALHGENAVRALFLLGSPSLGALTPYVWLKEGISSSGPGADFKLKNFALARTKGQTRNLLRGFPSAYQLLPTKELAKVLPWLQFDAHRTGYPEFTVGPTVSPDRDAQFPDCKAPTRLLYHDLYTGLNDPGSRELMKAARLQAEAFHLPLRTDGDTVYMHPSTYCVYSVGAEKKTVRSITVPFKSATPGTVQNINVHVEIGDLQMEVGPEGDGSVPFESANPASASPPFKDILPLHGVEHANIPKHRGTIEYLLGTIMSLLRAPPASNRGTQ